MALLSVCTTTDGRHTSASIAETVPVRALSVAQTGLLIAATPPLPAAPLQAPRCPKSSDPALAIGCSSLMVGCSSRLSRDRPLRTPPKLLCHTSVQLRGIVYSMRLVARSLMILCLMLVELGWLTTRYSTMLPQCGSLSCLQPMNRLEFRSAPIPSSDLSSSRPMRNSSFVACAPYQPSPPTRAIQSLMILLQTRRPGMLLRGYASLKGVCRAVARIRQISPHLVKGKLRQLVRARCLDPP